MSPRLCPLPQPPPRPRPRLTAAELALPRAAQGNGVEVPGVDARRPLRDLRRAVASPGQHPAQVAVTRQILGGEIPAKAVVRGFPGAALRHDTSPETLWQGPSWVLKSQGSNSHDFQGGELVKDARWEAGENVPGHVPAGQERKVRWKGPAGRGNKHLPSPPLCPHTHHGTRGGWAQGSWSLTSPCADGGKGLELALGSGTVTTLPGKTASNAPGCGTAREPGDRVGQGAPRETLTA